MSLRTRLRVIHVQLLRRFARDITERCAAASTLVLAPHPDDETIGCGGVIAVKRRRGTEVRVLIAADGGDLVRRSECLEACRRLGIDKQDVQFLGFPDGALDQYAAEVKSAIAHALVTRPAEMFVPSAIDAHPDHRALALAVAGLPRDTLHDVEVLAYPIWFWNRWAWVDRSTPAWKQRLQLVWRPLAHMLRARVVSVDTSSTLRQQQSALDAHQSQLHPEDGSTGLDREWLQTFLGSPALYFVLRKT
jgi:LmbE family N-acetylglucosaminyl deacetylase